MVVREVVEEGQGEADEVAEVDRERGGETRSGGAVHNKTEALRSANVFLVEKRQDTLESMA